MTFHPVYLLPLLAFAMVLFLPLFTKDAARSKSFRSKRRRKVLLGRLLVVILLIATVVTLIWPIEPLNSLVQGVVLSVLLWTPFLVAHWVYTFVRSRRTEAEDAELSDDRFESENVDRIQRVNETEARVSNRPTEVRSEPRPDTHQDFDEPSLPTRPNRVADSQRSSRRRVCSVVGLTKSSVIK